MSEGTRIDRWLWAVRLCPTRSHAAAACNGGHVRVGGRPAKPATRVAVGDRVEAHLHGRDRVVEVVRTIDQRVGAPVAAECYVDHTPVLPPEEQVRVAARLPGSGRPTKQQRRQLDAWRRRR
jgi:ribosome-associated heat shock protein Hsp15